MSGPEVEQSRPSPAPSASAETLPTQPSPPRWKFWRGRPETVLAIATIALVIATLLLAIISGIQAYILARTDQTAANALKAAQSEQRPILWLANDLGTPKWDDGNGGQIVWTWSFMNYGKVPAVRLSYRQKMYINNKVQNVPENNSPPYPSTSQEKSRGLNDDGSSLGTPLPTNKVDFARIVSEPGQDKSKFESLKDTIRIAATITYFDAVDRKYATTFCLKQRSGGIQYCDEEGQEGREGNEIK